MSGELEAWVGRERAEEDRVTSAPVARMLALLDRDPEALGRGDSLPPGWHWLYFNPAVPRSDLGPDGHERRGDFLPPVSLPRRMWAGGRLRFPGSLVIGRPARRRSTIEAVEEKEGRSGRLVFVTVGHRISQGGSPAVEEEQDLVYLEARDEGEAGERRFRGPDPPGAPAWSEPFSADPVTLFRFSAVTFNAHRIHYDHPYATGTEGYPGRVVHGPLLALLLLDAGRRWSGGDLDAFAYRARSPVFADEEIRLEGRWEEAGSTLELWARHPERGVAMTAEVRVR